MFFDDSRPDRQKRARRQNRGKRLQEIQASPVPSAKPFTLMRPEELFQGGARAFVFDIECYPNYFLVSFKCVDTGGILFFEDSPDSQIELSLLSFIVHRFLLIGFNSRGFDLPVLMVALQGARAPTLFDVAMDIIRTGLQPYEIERKYNVKSLRINHIDLIEVAPLQASLKLYAGRLHCPRMQDLPYQPETLLAKVEAEIVRDYNINDLDNTQILYEHLKPHIEMREGLSREYSTDLRSKSDAQIAEAVIGGELDKLGNSGRPPEIIPGHKFRYRVPGNLVFKTPQLNRVLDVVRSADFVIGIGGQADTPEAIAALRIALGQCVYQMGNGGLHSTEKSMAYVADDRTLIIDRDVGGYYPAIILNQGLYPEHLGPEFLTVYRTIQQRRLKAKKEGNKLEADGLKITVNGSFGKLGNPYSRFYSPELVTQVTMSGQLFLLMLIEAIELAGIPIISANTDGIVIKCPVERETDLNVLIIAWEEQTGFLTEETRYKGLYCRDVNNYIAVKLDGKCKTKGVFSNVGSALNSPLSKNPEGYISSLAVQEFLANGTPIAHTIEGCEDIRQFVSVRTVKGGAEKDGRYLGKAIRWYYAKGEAGTINYVLTGNKVPKSEGARPCMDLPAELPADLDFDHYIRVAQEMLEDIGAVKRREIAKLF